MDEKIASNRQKFNHHFGFFDPRMWYPRAYSQFAGKPNAKSGEITYNKNGFRELKDISASHRDRKFKIFVLGGSTMVVGNHDADTVPSLTERCLIASGLSNVQVYNFGVVSSCFGQMSALTWSELIDLRPDMLVVIGGGTELTNPWSFDPRPGKPYNSFAIEILYEILFEQRAAMCDSKNFDHDVFLEKLYQRLSVLREEYGWQTDAWETAVVADAQRALHRFGTLASAIKIPVLCILQPTIVRKSHLGVNESVIGSQEFLSYLARQYRRLDQVFYNIQKYIPQATKFHSANFSRLFEQEADEIFYDAAHYDERGRQIMAKALSAEIMKIIELEKNTKSWRALFRDRFRSVFSFLIRRLNLVTIPWLLTKDFITYAAMFDCG